MARLVPIVGASLKSIETMRETSPQTRNVTIVFNPTNPSNLVMLEALTRQLAHSGLAINSVPISSSADLDAACPEPIQPQPPSDMNGGRARKRSNRIGYQRCTLKGGWWWPTLWTKIYKR